MERIYILDAKLRLLQYIIDTPATQYMSELTTLIKALREELHLIFSAEILDGIQDISHSDLFKRLLLGLGSLGTDQEVVLSVLSDSGHDMSCYPSDLDTLSSSMSDLYMKILRTCCHGCMSTKFDTEVSGEDLLRFALSDMKKVLFLSTNDRKKLLFIISSSIFIAADISCPFCALLDVSVPNPMQPEMVLTNDSQDNDVDDIKDLSHNFELRRNSQFMGYSISPVSVHLPSSALKNFSWREHPVASKSIKSIQSPDILDVYLQTSIVIDERESVTSTAQAIEDSRPVVELSRMATTTTVTVDDAIKYSDLEALSTADIVPVAIPTSAKQQTNISYLSELPIARGITPLMTPGARRNGDHEASRVEHSMISNRSPSPIHYRHLANDTGAFLISAGAFNTGSIPIESDAPSFTVDTVYAVKEVASVQQSIHHDSFVIKERQGKASFLGAEPSHDIPKDEEVMISSLSCVPEKIVKGKPALADSVSMIERLDKIHSSAETLLDSLPEPGVSSPRQITAIKIKMRCTNENTDTAESVSIASAQPDTKDHTIEKTQDMASVTSPRSIMIRITRVKPLASLEDKPSNSVSSGVRNSSQDQNYTVIRLPLITTLKDNIASSTSGASLDTSDPVLNTRKDPTHMQRTSISYGVSSAILDAINRDPKTADLKINSIKIDCSVKDNVLESTISGTMDKEGNVNPNVEPLPAAQNDIHSTHDSLSSSLPAIPKPQTTASTIPVKPTIQGDALDESDAFQELTKSVKRQIEERSESPLVSISAHPSNYVSSLPISPPAPSQILGTSVQAHEQLNNDKVASVSSSSESPLVRRSQIYMPQTMDSTSLSTAIKVDQNEDFGLTNAYTIELVRLATPPSRSLSSTDCSRLQTPSKESCSLPEAEDEVADINNTSDPNLQELKELQDVLQVIGSSMNSRNASRAVSPQNHSKVAGVRLAQAIPLLVDMLDATEALIPKATAQASVMNIEVSIDDMNGMSSIYDHLIEFGSEDNAKATPPIPFQDTIMSPSQLNENRMQNLDEIRDAIEDTTLPLQGVNPEDVSAALIAEMEKEPVPKSSKGEPLCTYEDSADEILMAGVPLTKSRAGSQDRIRRGMCGNRTLSKGRSKASSKVGSRSTSRAISETPSETPSTVASVRSSRRLGKLKYSTVAPPSGEQSSKEHINVEEPTPTKLAVESTANVPPPSH